MSRARPTHSKRKPVTNAAPQGPLPSSQIGAEREEFFNPRIILTLRGEACFTGKYVAVASPVRLVALGYCRIDENGRLQTAKGMGAQISRRMDGPVAVSVRAAQMTLRDVRFRAALDHVLRGEPCADFELPKAPTHKAPRPRPRLDDGGAGVRP